MANVPTLDRMHVPEMEVVATVISVAQRLEFEKKAASHV